MAQSFWFHLKKTSSIKNRQTKNLSAEISSGETAEWDMVLSRALMQTIVENIFLGH